MTPSGPAPTTGAGDAVELDVAEGDAWGLAVLALCPRPASMVATKLKSMGYAPVSITESNQGLHKAFTFPGMGEKKVKLTDLPVFSRQFATMVNSGLSLLPAPTPLPDPPASLSTDQMGKGEPLIVPKQVVGVDMLFNGLIVQEPLSEMHKQQQVYRLALIVLL